MNKYLQLASTSLQNDFVYKTNILLWRLRSIVTSIMALTLWSAVFINTSSAFTYNRESMISYIFLTAILQSMILATALHGLPSYVYSGALSNDLLKPINIWIYLFIQDMTDKMKNFGFAIIESLILFVLFWPQLILPDFATLFLFGLSIFLGIALYYFISILFGVLGFYSPDVWGAKFLFFMFLDFTAGKLYPLDILPDIIQKIIYLTPFPYLTFFQTQIFLGKMTADQLTNQFMVLLGWTVGMYFLARWQWGKGIKNYESTGR